MSTRRVKNTPVGMKATNTSLALTNDTLMMNPDEVVTNHDSSHRQQQPSARLSSSSRRMQHDTDKNNPRPPTSSRKSNDAPKSNVQKNQIQTKHNLLLDFMSTVSTGHKYEIGEAVKCRDLYGTWQTGVITNLKPLLVQEDGYTVGTRWDEVSPIFENVFAVGDVVWTKLEGTWIKGEIIYVRNSYPSYAFRSGVTSDYFNVFGTHGFCNNFVYFAWMDEKTLYPDGASDVEEDMGLFLNDLLLATVLQDNENEWSGTHDAHSEAIAHLMGENEIQKLQLSGELSPEGYQEYKQQFHHEIVAGLIQDGELSYTSNVDIFREGEEALYQEQNDEEISRQIGEQEEEKKK